MRITLIRTSPECASGRCQLCEMIWWTEDDGPRYMCDCPNGPNGNRADGACHRNAGRLQIIRDAGELDSSVAYRMESDR